MSETYLFGDHNNGIEMHEARTGWVVTIHTRWQGGHDGARYLVRYGTLGLERGTDLNARWNDLYTNGMILGEHALDYARNQSCDYDPCNGNVRRLDRGTLLH